MTDKSAPPDAIADAVAVAVAQVDCSHHRVPEQSVDQGWHDWSTRVAAGERQRLCHRCERWVWESLWPA
ncbi:MAG: hypothetical protein DLM54_04480 [Acidimicrobiales bacterium]|nr:MAG: hypothetical protein DLM54_04480 [Acidimicrobiales bacterium]